jgi:hypothetical protein
MTKPRDPSSFEEAALIMARDFGAVEAGRLVDRGPAALRHWSDPDHDGRPTIHQAAQLDIAHAKAFGTTPFLHAYVAQLNEGAPEAMRSRAVGDLLSEAMDVPIGTGELLATLKSVRLPQSPGGKKISAAERAAIQKQLKRLRDEIDDVEAALKKS